MSLRDFFRSSFAKKFHATPARKGSRSRRYCVETLESRFVPTVSAVFSSGLLTITGDNGANDIDVTYSTVSGVNYLTVTSSGGTILDGTPSGSNIAASAVIAINIDAGDGNDLVDLSPVTATNGFSGISSLTDGIDNKITISGGNGSDTLVGSAFGDIFNGGTGDDSLSGGAGNDLFAYIGSSLGSDVVTEAANADTDWIYLGFFGAGVTIDLSSTSAQNIGGSTTITLSNSTGIENIVGSGFADSLTGNSRDNSIQGAAGNDTLIGGVGSDYYIFNSGDGSDSITESSDSDSDTLDFSGASSGVTIDLSSTSSQSWVSGSSITLSSATGIEQVIGSNYADSLTGNSLDNAFAGGAGNDTLAGGSGNDLYYFLSGSEGSDLITESANVDEDWLLFLSPGGPVNIDLSATASQNWGGGTLTLSTSTSIESVVGSSNNDTIAGNSRSNHIVGGDGNDSISGADGNDTLEGENGDDTIVGGNGSDVITGGTGNDSLTGGAGNDTYLFTESLQGTDNIIEASNSDTDTLDFSGTGIGVIIDISLTTSQSWGDGTIVLSAADGLENVTGSEGADTVTGNARSNLLFGGSGNDTISAGSGDDNVIGGDGDDSILGGDGNDLLYGLSGDDTIYGGNDRDALAGGDGADVLSGDGDDDIIISGTIGSQYGPTAAAVVMAYWTSGDTYSNRVADVRGDMGAPVPLPEGFRLVKDETVYDDSSVDTLTGGGGNDLFFLNGTQDDATDVGGSEVDIDIS